MKKKLTALDALMASIIIGGIVWGGSILYEDQQRQHLIERTANVWCFGDYAGQFTNEKGEWVSTETARRKINGENIKLVEGRPLPTPYKYCDFNYDLDEKYQLPAGFTRTNERGDIARVVSSRSVGRGFSLQVEINGATVEMPQSQYLKSFEYWVE